MNHFIKIIGIAVVVLFASCNTEGSLQQYFIDHQQDADFIAIDVPSSLLDKDKIELSAEEREALESIKKINFLALPVKESNKSRYAEEKARINTILNTDKYETLMRFGSNGAKGVLKYIGDDDDIDEVIVFGSHKEKGLAIIRVLGDNMRPEKIAQLAKSVEKGNLDLGAFKEIVGVINAN